MERFHPGGIDADGYILTVPNVEVQPQFQDLLADVCMTLTRSEPLLDGIYLYGSVARGDAVPGVSDLDLTLILHSPPASQDLEMLESKRRTLESRHTEVIKIDFDIGSRSEVLAADNRLSWGYWLKHHCRCLWGNDLTRRFDRFKPSRDIAIAFHQGTCLCGAVKYQVSTELKAVTHCHCSQCRKGHGAAFATYASVPRSAVSIMASAETLKGYQSSEGVTRQFCSNCGSSLFWSDSKGSFPDWISVATGTLDTPFLAEKQKHACVSSKASWYEIQEPR
ncbi:GFA family protein [Pseudomonas frederiksbergensis]|nr:GFA family protein [Pseudomonas frederiksbergensis]